MVRLEFLRLNIISDYNLYMGGIDVADKLHNQYRFDHWLQKFN